MRVKFLLYLRGGDVMSIDVTKVAYSLVLLPPDGREITIAGLLMKGTLEELEGELAARLTATFRNIKLKDGWLHQHAYLTRRVLLKATDGVVTKEVFSGTVVRWRESSTDHTVSFTAYDHLFNFQRSKERLYFPKETAASSIRKVASKGGIPVGQINGPSVKLANKLYREGSLGDIIADRLEESRRKGSGRYIARSTQGKLEVVKEASNSTIYLLDNRFVEDSSDEHDIESLVTRVKIYGNEDKKGRSVIKSTMERNTEFGKVQDVIYSSAKNMAEAKKEAEEILNEKSKPKIERILAGPCIPWVRKGDLIEAMTGTICWVKDGEVIPVPVIVKSISHDIINMRMNLKVRG